MAELSANCIIVGGGIGGAVLALILGREGKRVLLLERELAPQGGRRPEILARSTMEIFRGLGAGERILKEAAIPLRSLEAYQNKDELILSFNSEDFERSNAQPYPTDPVRTREILLETALQTKLVELRRGVEVKELLFDGARVRGVRAVSGEERQGLSFLSGSSRLAKYGLSRAE